MKKLALNKDVLTEVSDDELGQVAGGTHLTCYCVSYGAECGHGLSFDYCPTVPVNQCVNELINLTV